MWFSSKAKKNASFIREKWSRMTISWPQIPEIDCKCSQWIVPAQRFTIQNESSHPAFLSNVLCPVMFFTTPPQLIASPPFQEPLCHPSARGPCHHLWAWPGASSAPCLAPLTRNLQRFNGKNGLSLKFGSLPKACHKEALQKHCKTEREWDQNMSKSGRKDDSLDLII